MVGRIVGVFARAGRRRREARSPRARPAPGPFGRLVAQLEGLRSKLGYEGSHPSRAASACAVRHVPLAERSVSGGRRELLGAERLVAPLVACRYQKASPAAASGRDQSSANATVDQPVIGRTFSCPT